MILEVIDDAKRVQDGLKKIFHLTEILEDELKGEPAKEQMRLNMEM